MEAMISIAIMGVVSVGFFRLLNDGTYMWNMGSAKLAITGEARLAMTMIKRLVQECQGSTISLSRLNSNAPAFSYMRAIQLETVYITTTQQRCGCGATTDVTTVGSKGSPVQVFQYPVANKGSSLLAVYPLIRPGTDLTDNAAVQANTYYRTLTISANLESLSFGLKDSKKGTVVVVNAKFSKKPFGNKPPVTYSVSESIVVKHMHSAGYYYN